MQAKYAYYDQMTGLLNRRKFSEKSDEFKLFMPPYCCVVMVDINGLKAMNDTYGHEAGDELIIGAAECLKAAFDGVESIFRIGGDEFCVILTDPQIDVESCLDQLEASCQQRKGHYVKNISVSHGFASTEEFTDFRTILKTADHRMYENKRSYYSAANADNTQNQT
ncbi:MAG: GGDEF domain-containing protein [Ruminococcus sp.]|uniref:GGDEF domain-containing protein n=1 Tax=Ruminococcus sp. TaxID=41978 RepID=UPI00287367D2|nr:GGDEF domain-containing protein [Ruminococcus sp.]MBQ3284577.1 GGDEF domain-containing protein [Ruminococcus sp.]